MKVFSIIMKIVAALAVVAGIVYVVATYGDKIVAWAKKLLGKFECCCCGDEDCCCDGECCCDEDCCCDDDCCCECECDEECVEEAAPAAEAEEADFEG